MTGLDPSIYRDRYPKELSGGQAQRVGVARALGADPAVLLMDEPFGAIDPITRDRLQNEFLRLQEELQKTIVFVTHDVDEAIKMGDRIAILRDRSEIAQLDTPARILAYPVDDFVADFIGSGSTLEGLNFERVRDVELDLAYPIVAAHSSHEDAKRVLRESDEQWLLVTDSDGRPRRWIHEDQLADTSRPLIEAGSEVQAKVLPNATLHDALEALLLSSAGCACVVDGQGHLLGVLDVSTLTEVLQIGRAHV